VSLIFSLFNWVLVVVASSPDTRIRRQESWHVIFCMGEFNIIVYRHIFLYYAIATVITV